MKHCVFGIVLVILVGNIICAPPGFGLKLHQSVINTPCINNLGLTGGNCLDGASQDVINVPCIDGFKLIRGVCREVFKEDVSFRFFFFYYLFVILNQLISGKLDF